MCCDGWRKDHSHISQGSGERRKRVGRERLSRYRSGERCDQIGGNVDGVWSQLTWSRARASEEAPVELILVLHSRRVPAKSMWRDWRMRWIRARSDRSIGSRRSSRSKRRWNSGSDPLVKANVSVRACDAKHYTRDLPGSSEFPTILILSNPTSPPIDSSRALGTPG